MSFFVSSGYTSWAAKPPAASSTAVTGRQPGTNSARTQYKTGTQYKTAGTKQQQYNMDQY
eukprot:3408838-Rhodomonas_salina.1